jgi:hypothetical protein
MAPFKEAVQLGQCFHLKKIQFIHLRYELQEVSSAGKQNDEDDPREYRSRLIG